MSEPVAVVLAAGRGTRMKSDLPKVLFPALGRPMLHWVLDSLAKAGIKRSIVVVGYRADDVKKELEGREHVGFALQAEQLGTGHAVEVCRDQLEGHDGPVMVVAGDSPLIQPASIQKVLEEFRSGDWACLLGTLLKDDPTGLGRIVRGNDGRFERIVEQKDATSGQNAIKEVNMSTYMFQCEALLWALKQLNNSNAQGEYYLTDCPEILRRDGRNVDALPVLQPCESLSINTIDELKLVEDKMREMGYPETLRTNRLRPVDSNPPNQEPRKGGKQTAGVAQAKKATLTDHLSVLTSLKAKMRELKILSGRANPQLAQDICGFLHLELGSILLDKFPDGENYCKIEEDVRGRDVFLIQSTCPPVNDNLMELLIMIDSCKRASASRITVVIPYFGYARQDRKDEGRTPITAKLVANMITRAGADRVLTMDLHAPQIQGFFDVPVDHLYAAPVLNGYFKEMGYSDEEIVVVSPDEGSIKRAIGHSKRLGGRLAIVDKRRDNALETTQKNIIGGPVEGKVCLMFDDMISTAGSICGAAKLVHEFGAKEIHLAATHGVLCGDAVKNLSEAPIASLCVTNTIPLPAEKKLGAINIVSVAPLLAEAIRRIHHDLSISELFPPGSEDRP